MREKVFILFFRYTFVESVGFYNKITRKVIFFSKRHLSRSCCQLGAKILVSSCLKFLASNVTKLTLKARPRQSFIYESESQLKSLLLIFQVLWYRQFPGSVSAFGSAIVAITAALEGLRKHRGRKKAKE